MTVWEEAIASGGLSDLLDNCRVGKSDRLWSRVHYQNVILGVCRFTGPILVYPNNFQN
ncbi:MAG: hypothetical protein P5694_20900 [Limnospira sp. PMC 1286.21]|uniref:hypothetical protein n=1 Tax=unclassified Limnospira TaxID=2642885 RepID=UPI0028E0AA33|nr:MULTISPECIES: hypothetical protein [unclassified Limnospira]MDT9195389.1 hypothetical protein [Limnospira sp. PMC 1245.20]MDT9215859.1 hypothetical protein [Limnospira sp. PMC 1256.20]MDT9256722.1 hypothetical protein [Limnospira sp. PMC 1254.20]MDT9302651.1 hypothetical protein [Limnospira sp. PMC 1281.21]MDT9323040.1 hypothetical protein [Limnospira sp. PMC 1290.21]